MSFKSDIILDHPLGTLLCPPTLLKALENVCFLPERATGHCSHKLNVKECLIPSTQYFGLSKGYLLKFDEARNQ